MSDGTVKIDSLPADNELYVITNYGGLIKNHSFAVDIPLIKVTLNRVQNNTIKTPSISCLVGLPELSTVRIGTIWKNQVRLESYWSEYKDYEEYIQLTFDLKKYPAKNVRYVKHHNDNKTKLRRIEVHDDRNIEEDEENQFYGSTFTEFTSEDGIKYIVSSIELLMSTYVPKNKLIRNELLSYNADVVIQNYIEDYSCTKESYTVHLEKILEKETMVFLAHLACNKKSRANISKLWASIEGKSVSNERHVNVLPYHPETISFKASGVWLDENTFYIQRIYNPKPPLEKKLKAFGTRSTVAPEENGEQDIGLDGEKVGDMPKTPLNQNQIKEETSIVHNRNPGGNAGSKYIVSETVPDNEGLDIEITEDVQVNDNSSASYNKEKNDVEAASSGKLSGSNESEKVAMTKYVVEENPTRLDYAVEIENSLNDLLEKEVINSIKYIDDNAGEHDLLVYSSFGKQHINLDGNKFWASGYVKGTGVKKSRAGYRKLLIMKIKINDLNPFYILEIVRKVKSDKFKGIVFQTDNDLDIELLENIKSIIAVNKGHFKKTKKAFLTKKAALYKHTWGEMKKRFENVFESLKVKKIFD